MDGLRKKRLARRRGILWTAGLVALVASVTSFALGDTGSVSPLIAPAAGVSTSNGEVATVQTGSGITTSITRSNGAASLDSGVVLAAIQVAPSFATQLNVGVFWTDPYDAYAALNNPHAQISVGLYYPVHTGACTNTDSSETDAYVEVSYQSVDYCSVLDATATGSSNVSKGKLIMVKSAPSGFLLPDVTDNNYPTPTACPTSATETTSSWCQPSGVSPDGVIFVCASILTPGGVPPGQQANLANLSFFINATRA